MLSAGILSDVGQAAARGRAPDGRTLARLEQLAAKDPLSAQPFLVQGAIAAREGDYERAERLLAHRTPSETGEEAAPEATPEAAPEEAVQADAAFTS